MNSKVRETTRWGIECEFAAETHPMQMKSPAVSFLRTVRAFLQLSWYVENVTEKTGSVNCFLMYYMKKLCLIAVRVRAKSRKSFILKHLLYF